MNDFRIDSHKLLFHPRRVADWLEGKPIAPLYLEVSPSGMCNHRCRFCGMDYVGYPQRRLPGELFRARQPLYMPFAAARLARGLVRFGINEPDGQAAPRILCPFPRIMRGDAPRRIVGKTRIQAPVCTLGDIHIIRHSLLP